MRFLKPDKKQRSWPLLLACLIPPLTLLIFVIVAEDWQARFTYLTGIKKDCKKYHTSGGFVRKSMTLARMSAITSWIKEVEVYGQDYSLWTNADRRFLRCRKVNGTPYINCIALATPCRLIYDRNKEEEKLMVQHRPEKLIPTGQNLSSLARYRTNRLRNN